MEKPKRLYLYDTTLRDGQQSKGINFSLQEKLQIIKQLDDFGIDYIEAGYAGGNPVDDELFENLPTVKNAEIAAFAMTKRAGKSIHNDAGMQSLLKAGGSTKCIVGKTWDMHVTDVLGIELDENLHLIQSSIEAVKNQGFEAIFDCEHFFDGMKNNEIYALKCLDAALKAGVDWIVLCDTNGGCLPGEIYQIVLRAIEHSPNARFGIHTHNDTGNATANTLAAVDAGVLHIQGTLNGVGERCGNADLISIIPTLKLKSPYKEKIEISIKKQKLADIKILSNWFDELLNRNSDKHAPYVGANAFAHKGGIHGSAIQKNVRTYEHIEPALVGNIRDLTISGQTGKSNIINKLKKYDIDFDQNSGFLSRFAQLIKEKEAQGLSYDYADASFKLLALRQLGKCPKYFEVDSFRVIVEQRHNAIGKIIHVSEAVIKIVIQGQKHVAVGEGNGPVNAIDQALRKCLVCYDHILGGLELDDYKVRIIGNSSAALTRVLIRSTDGKGEYWTTVGVSTNIVDSSLQALLDSVVYKLYNEEKNNEKKIKC